MLATTSVSASEPVTKLDRYNVVWDSPSQDALGSMPLGNGDIGINAWVEPSGDLVFYVSKTDAWDENGRLCKIGRVRVKFNPALAPQKRFRQELKLRDGTIQIHSEVGNWKSEILLWVDANQPVVHLEMESSEPVSCRAEVELWRVRERPFGGDDDSHSGKGLHQSDFKPMVLPDVVVTSAAPRVTWYHRNTRSIYDLSLKVQHLEALKGLRIDPLLNFTFGASLRGEGFVPDGKLALKSATPVTRQSLSVTVLRAQTTTPEAWLTQLDKLEDTAGKIELGNARRAHDSWWQDFWTRSWVYVDGIPEAQTVTRGYVLQRFMSACSGRGGSPIKFNGSIFNVEKQPGASAETPAGDPDWRRWGGNYWFQNTRLIYWSMLAAGDFDLMEPWFRMYRNALPLGKARVKTYYQYDNAVQFPETMFFWGLPNNVDYGWSNTLPEPSNTYIRRYWNSNLELIAVMLDRYDFTQDKQFAKDMLLPLADPLIAFLDDYWQKRDANGKIVMDPAQSLETYHSAINPLPEIAGLRFLLPRLLALPDDLTNKDQRVRWARILRELPPLPVAEVAGVKLLRPAATIIGGSSNSENPELYSVFPYRLFGVGRPELELARATFEKRRNHHNNGWCQDSIQAACLGLSDEAGQLVAARANKINSAARFPAMWGPNFDWIPDQDHGNNILTTLQFMLLQSDGTKLYLFPAWPQKWDVDFKLHAPDNTVVECVLKNSKITNLKVAPEIRRKDVILPEWAK